MKLEPKTFKLWDFYNSTGKVLDKTSHSRKMEQSKGEFNSVFHFYSYFSPVLTRRWEKEIKVDSGSSAWSAAKQDWLK